MRRGNAGARTAAGAAPPRRASWSSGSGSTARSAIRGSTPGCASARSRRLIVAGVYLHGCVRSTALDAYERGYEVGVADDAVGTTEPLHAELTRAWLAARAASFARRRTVLAELDDRQRRRAARAGERAAGRGDRERAAGRRRGLRLRAPRSLPHGAGPRRGTARRHAEIATAAARRGRGAAPWAARPTFARARRLSRALGGGARGASAPASSICSCARSPSRAALRPRRRWAAPSRTRGSPPSWCATAPPARSPPASPRSQRPVGVVGLSRPWNNPLAIPVGKIAPALAFGNAVVLKPAPQASRDRAGDAGESGRAGLSARARERRLRGRRDGARALPRAGASRRLGHRVDRDRARRRRALRRGDEAVAGRARRQQRGDRARATPISSAVVPDLVAGGLRLRRATLHGDPPLRRRARGRGALRGAAVRGDARARDRRSGRSVDRGRPADLGREARSRARGPRARARRGRAPGSSGGRCRRGLAHGAWLAPALLADVDPTSRIAQEETFGPVAVLQVAHDLEDALALANGVPHGLVMSVHTRDAAARARILEAAQAGIVQLAPGPARRPPARAVLGWKASGLGPPEHGTLGRRLLHADAGASTRTAGADAGAAGDAHARRPGHADGRAAAPLLVPGRGDLGARRRRPRCPSGFSARISPCFAPPTARSGSLDARCPHRGASLAYGIVDDCSMRCAYHGWRFDRAGACLEIPSLRRGGAARASARGRGAYQVEELGGLVFAYLGPEPAPLLPRYDLFVWHGVLRDIGRALIPCNWLQIMENSVDPDAPRVAPRSPPRGGAPGARALRPQAATGGGTRRSASTSFPMASSSGGCSRAGAATTTTGGSAIRWSFRDGARRRPPPAPLPDPRARRRHTHAALLVLLLSAAPDGAAVPVQDEIPVYDVPFRDERGEFLLDFVDGGDIMAWVSQGRSPTGRARCWSTPIAASSLLRRLLFEQIARVGPARIRSAIVRSAGGERDHRAAAGTREVRQGRRASSPSRSP